MAGSPNEDMLGVGGSRNNTLCSRMHKKRQPQPPPTPVSDQQYNKSPSIPSSFLNPTAAKNTLVHYNHLITGHNML